MSSNNSKIEWTDKTWNPVTGCTKVSQGCKHCYAERIYERFNGKGSFKNVICHDDRLSQPFKWKKPAMVFVNSMSDLFHEDVPFEFIRKVMGVIHDKQIHTFQILTKRAERMYEFFKWLNNSNLAVNFPNMWLGVSVEDQKSANERIPFLLQVPSAVRFLSCEPLLGPVNLAEIRPEESLHYFNCLSAPILHKGYMPDAQGLVNWVIVGGESGPGARAMHPEWASTIRDQCKKANVPFFFKQWGEYTDGAKGNIPVSKWNMVGNDGSIYKDNQVVPQGLNCTLMTKVGKKAAGREIGGVIHNEFPKQ